MSKKLQHKSFEFTDIKVDTDSRTISGYASIFNVVDSDADLITKGAFAKTLNENAHRIVHLYQHNPTQLLGRPTLLIEDEKGLYFETVIANTTLGDEVLELYKNGTIKEHSIGFQTVKSTDKGSYREITEVKLFEFSSVTWGANQYAQFTGFKSEFGSNQIVENTDKILKMLKAEITNDTVDQLNIFLNQIKTIHLHLEEKSVEELHPSSDSVDDIDPIEIPVEELKNENQELKSANDMALIHAFMQGFKSA